MNVEHHHVPKRRAMRKSTFLTFSSTISLQHATRTTTCFAAPISTITHTISNPISASPLYPTYSIGAIKRKQRQLQRTSFISSPTERFQPYQHSQLNFHFSSYPVRLQPKCHSSCHSSHSHTHKQSSSITNSESLQNEISPFLKLINRITALRYSLLAGCTSAVLLVIAGILHISSLPILLIRLPLAGCVALTGIPAVLDSVRGVFVSKGSALNVEVLMSLAAAVCVCTGAVFEGALLTTLLCVSHAAEEYVTTRARKELDVLRDTAQDHALRVSSITGNDPESVLVDEIQIGDLVLVRSGEVVPCDGTVVSGSAYVSMQHLTGEANPRSVGKGSVVPAGARTEDAPIVVRVTQIGSESSMARIARLVMSAQENRPPVSKFFDRFGKTYTRTVLMISAFLAAFLPVISSALAPFIPAIKFAGKSGSLARALGFLVVASPCALVIGGPIAYLAALSSCARRGVLAKSGAKSLEAASRVGYVVFDKTGTLTTGNLKVTSISFLKSNLDMFSSTNQFSRVTQHSPALDLLPQLEQEDLSHVLLKAAALEQGAVHPIASAIKKRAKEIKKEMPEVTEVKIVPGHGVEGCIITNDSMGNMEMTLGRLGSPKFVLEHDEIEFFRGTIKEASSRGETVSVFEDGGNKYLLRMRDEVRDESREVVQGLLTQGCAVTVLTGDGEGAATTVGSAIGGEIRVVSNATPEEKLDYVTKLNKRLTETNSGVLMVGDGVNDAAALAASLVGVSCGLSSATAVHAADVVLIREDLTTLPWFLSKARATKIIVRQNLILALGLMVFSTIACTSGSIPLWLAVTLHEGGTLLVGVNGLRLLR